MNPTTHIHDLYSTIVNDLEILAEPKASEKRRAWFNQQHKGSIKCYGIKTPDIRRLIRKYAHEFNQLTLKEKFGLAKMFYTSNWFEQATIGDALVEYAVKTINPAHFDLLDEIVDYFNNWDSRLVMSPRVAVFASTIP